MHVKCLALVKIYHISVKVHKAQNENENRCGYGTVLSVMAGQMYYNQQQPEHIGMSCMTGCVMHMPIPERTDT
jgi:hypothetical protein